MGMVKNSQSSQNSKFAMSLLFLKKEVEDEVDFFPFKEILSLMGIIRHSRSTQNNKFAISVQYLKKEVRMELIFCMQINIKVSSKLLLIMVYKIGNMYSK